MAFIESQQNPGIVQEVDPANRASRVSIRPVDHTTLQGKILGHYRVAAFTAAIAPAANAVLAAFRWTDPTNYCLILGVKYTVTVVTAITAARLDPVVLNLARAYTVRDLTNATVVNVSGNNQKVRTTMSTSLVGNIDVASAAAGLTGGTKSVDVNPLALGVPTNNLIGLGTAIGGVIWDSENNYAHPILLGSSEGILLSWGATIQASGTTVTGIEFKWAEVAGF